MNGLKTKCGFTLIEMMTVTLIIAVLFILTIPAFQSMTRKNTNAAGSQLISTIRLARQYAVTHRQDTYVVFPTTTPVYGSPAEVTKALSSYAVISSNPAAGRLEYVSDWKFLPKGVYFDDSASSVMGTVQENVLRHAQSSFPFPNDFSGSLRAMPALKFRPNGKLYYYSGTEWRQPSLRLKVYLTSCRYYDLNTTAGTITRGVKDPPGVTNAVWIYSKSGQVMFKEADTIYD